MFQPTHFLALHLPTYFAATLPPRPGPILVTLSLLKDFLKTTLTLYRTIDDSIHLLSFLSTHFSLSPETPSSNMPFPPNATLLNILLQSESE